MEYMYMVGIFGFVFRVASVFTATASALALQPRI